MTESKVVGGAVSRGYFPAVEKGVQEAMLEGGLRGFPVVDVGVTLLDGKEHAVDSSELAFKLAARRGDTNEIARIKVNPYTKGVVLSALEFEAREGLPGVVSWVRNGTEVVLPATRVASATAAPEPVRELRPPPPPATKLELRSLLRTSKRTVAVINGERFELGSELSMLIDGKRRLVRLESAAEISVVVTVDGARQTRSSTD